MAAILDLYKISQIIAIKNITCGNFHYERRHFVICDWQSASSDISNLLIFFATAENIEQSLNFHEEDRRTENFLIALHNSNELCIVAAESRIRVFDIQRLLCSTRSDMNCL